MNSTQIKSSSRSPHRRRIILGSFIEEFNNRVDIVSFNEESLTVKLNPHLSFDHPYPPTKRMFHPNPTAGDKSSTSDSSGNYLRLWDVKGASGVEPISVFNNSKTSEYCALLISFDWDEVEPGRIGTSSIDTTCTIWDIERGAVETQLIAHDNEVHDIAWGKPGFSLLSRPIALSGCSI